MIDTDHRPAVIEGLRELAAFLEANPAVPVPPHGVTVLHFPARGTDAEMIAEIDRIAALLGTAPDPDDMAHGHHKARLAFGPVSYEALAILAAPRARYAALASYSGCVVPDAADVA
ncbi:hypothetical protein Ppa06_36880 [Planomonospora parontospora subsp. parontospora]|uniref:Uncharacterized protein n=2 Tax=Planomonospora parontospora TaxID=58119 RepID=A0AA37F4Z5_9ACTN|nr:hypothetical protein [Planomonospora parontospora]GGK69866.1 hypothetical protein GCM10010126_31560 [Planomonospora parontospora]GII09890.1 hypothetical protein Ppa06_36880 [Planomonospora parontospora subsp. parontospora]